MRVCYLECLSLGTKGWSSSVRVRNGFPSGVPARPATALYRDFGVAEGAFRIILVGKEGTRKLTRGDAVAA